MIIKSKNFKIFDSDALKKFHKRIFFSIVVFLCCYFLAIFRIADVMLIEINLKKNQSLIGSTEKVLIDLQSEDGSSIGRSYRDAPQVDNFIRVDELLPVGEFVDIKITEAFEYDVKGEAVNVTKAV